MDRGTDVTEQAAESTPEPERVSLATIVREWARIGCIGFGGPPTHIKLLRELCVQRRGWLDAREFEDAIAVCNLLPGPASTELAIFCAWRLRRRRGALIGGAAFIIPGLIVILALSAVFLAKSPPLWVLGAGAGAGAAVPAVAVHAGSDLARPSWRRRRQTLRWLAYLVAGAAAAATIGEWLVLVLLGCGLAELTAQLADSHPDADHLDGDHPDGAKSPGAVTAPLLAAGVVGGGVLLSVAWVAFKVGALSWGGGFVIIPLMRADAVSHYHWMTGAQFLNAVALGQITPGPVVQTVAVVGYAAAGLAGGLLASLIAFTPSFAFILFGGHRFDQIRRDRRARSFLDGAGPAAIGAIFGSAIPLARSLDAPVAVRHHRRRADSAPAAAPWCRPHPARRGRGRRHHRPDGGAELAPPLRPQLAAEQLPGRRPRQLGDELHRSGALECRQPPPAVRDQLGRQFVGARFVPGRLDDGKHRLSHVRVGHADHGDVGHRRVPDQRLLDLPGVDVDAAGDDQVGAPVAEVQEALGVEVADVAQGGPALLVTRAGRLGRVVAVLEGAAVEVDRARPARSAARRRPRQATCTVPETARPTEPGCDSQSGVPMTVIPLPSLPA